jgi:hypothetical protein
MSHLVDFHSHFFSRVFFETLAAQSEQPGTPDARLERIAKRTGLVLPARDNAAHAAQWLAELERYGVAHIVTFASVPEEAPVVLEAVRASEGRMSGLSVVNPRAPEAPERVRELLERGLRGVLLFPAMHGFDIAGPEAARVLAVLEPHAGIAVVHCGLLQVKLRDLLGLPRTFDVALANPLALIPTADAFPGVRFVVPHFGAGFLRETLMAGALCPNVFVDTSSSNAWMATQARRTSLVEVFERALGVFGAERVLFGTDSSTFPRGWRHDLYMAQREALGALGASAQDRARIFGDNAARLLGLSLAG